MAQAFYSNRLSKSLKILVTGADGFIGSHLVERLVRLGHDVKAFVLYNSHNSWGWLDDCAADVKGKFEVFAGDIRDPHGVRVAVKNVDTVFHLASLIGIPYSYHSPESYFLTMTDNIFNCGIIKEDGIFINRPNGRCN